VCEGNAVGLPLSLTRGIDLACGIGAYKSSSWSEWSSWQCVLMEVWRVSC